MHSEFSLEANTQQLVAYIWAGKPATSIATPPFHAQFPDLKKIHWKYPRRTGYLYLSNQRRSAVMISIIFAHRHPNVLTATN
jgi:hypothetical protein